MKNWYYHKDFPEGKIFDEADKPKGCVDHPDLVKKTRTYVRSKSKTPVSEEVADVESEITEPDSQLDSSDEVIEQASANG